MSYSFAVKGKTRAELLEAAAVEFAKVVDAQPIHAHDAEAAKQCREQVLAALPGETPPEGKDFYLSCSGSLSWEGITPDHKIVGVSVNAYASFQAVSG